ncbi:MULTISPECIES: M56 family metallopeptidase [Aequorivita]|uniref:M56 family metallopeptidase n=1 Tax=Aequorivita iocasae TaxID=2803865 RepID=A0ABX7DVE8_9FLAO|nr:MULTISPECIES: M56 family metallopeptidase [Aequorivita]QQX77984.1 M56 family metallopeptidase [Aequorivita iocasae]UCA57487.1 M56 family metallopeptidase [Aequorivita sp. F7]
MELYLLKSGSILAILFTFYKVALENTSLHTFKRFYLFGSLLASFFIPLITFTSYIEVSPIVPIYSEVSPQSNYTEVEQTLNFWPFVLWTIYGLGVLFFSIKFFRSLFGLIQKIRKNPKYKNTPFINVLLNETVIPHTFFNYIFLNKKQFENREIPQEVIFHEETHARQKHSLDIIFIEILQIVFWFNPLFYFFKKSIKLNHEFLADRAVLNAGAETSDYQKILLAFSSNAATPSLAHSLNYSSIKKRFTLMKTRTSKRAIWFRSLLILPLLSVLIYGFSSKEIIQKNAQTNESIKEKATKAEVAEYNKLAKKYNAVDIEERIIKKKDLERLETIYRKMNDEQKANAETFPECLPPPPPKPPKAPKPPKVKKGEKSDVPPPPPAPKVSKTPSAENGNLYMAPEAPPAPLADPVEYVKELGKRGATFYIGPHKYSTDEAIEMVKKSTNDVTIDVNQYPIVHLDGC